MMFLSASPKEAMPELLEEFLAALDAARFLLGLSGCGLFLLDQHGHPLIDGALHLLLVYFGFGMCVCHRWCVCCFVCKFKAEKAIHDINIGTQNINWGTKSGVWTKKTGTVSLLPQCLSV